APQRRPRDAALRRTHRALRAPGRGADPRRTARLAVVAQALEAQALRLPEPRPLSSGRDAGPLLPERTGQGILPRPATAPARRSARGSRPPAAPGWRGSRTSGWP